MGETEFTTDVVRAASTKVFSELKTGLTEAIYRNALAILLRKQGWLVSCEVVMPVIFEGETIGFLRSDIVVDQMHVIELKVASKITDAHVAQARAYVERLPKGASAHVVNFGNTILSINDDDNKLNTFVPEVKVAYSK